MYTESLNSPSFEGDGMPDNIQRIDPAERERMMQEWKDELHKVLCTRNRGRGKKEVKGHEAIFANIIINYCSELFFEKKRANEKIFVQLFIALT